MELFDEQNMYKTHECCCGNICRQQQCHWYNAEHFARYIQPELIFSRLDSKVLAARKFYQISSTKRNHHSRVDRYNRFRQRVQTDDYPVEDSRGFER